MTAVKSALWWVVLLSCHHAIIAAKDHHSVDDKPYKRLAIRSNTTGTLDNVSSPYSSATILSTPSSTRTKQDASPQPHVPSDAVSDTSFTVPRSSSVEGIDNATPTNRDDGSSSTARARDSDARIFGDTFIASITTHSRPPLTAPSNLASQRNSTNLAFPTFSPSITNNVTTTTTKGQYTNSSTVTRPSSTTVSLPTTTEDFCTSTNGPFSTVIEYSIIHTWTITWLGDPADYTPPFPTISAPRPCTPTTTSATGRFTISVCDSSGQSCSLIHVTGEPTPTAPTDPWWVWITDTSAIRGMEPTLTFVTTDRNPAVVFPTSLPPDYGGSPDPKGNVHSAAYPNEAQSPDPPGYGSEATTKQNVKSASLAPPVTVIVKPSVVVIDDQTFTNDPAQPTSTVVVNQNTFTINPTQVIGVDATLTRPPSGGGVTPPQPTETTISGIGVSIVEGPSEGSSMVVIDKTSFTIGPKPSTVTIRDQAITIGPGAIVFPSQTLGIPVARDTTQVVFGAELITAIGSDKVVIEGRTITYGPGSSTITEVIDGDTIIIGPSGITAHGETYGGSHATATETQFAVVGGVTISQIGSTVVVIQGVTHTLDPLVPGQIKTTVIGGERITIGPEGVGIESWTLDLPFASTTTITPNSGPTVVMSTATATAGNPNNENNGSSLASKRAHWLLVTCIGLTAYFLRTEVL